MKILFPKARALGAAAVLLGICCAGQRQAYGSNARLGQPLVAGNSLEIEWNSGGQLQTAPSPNGPWTNVPEPPVQQSRSVIPVSPANLFFRVIEHGVPTEPMPLLGVDPAHPFKIDRAFLRKGITQRGNALLEVELMPGQNPPRTFPLLNDAQVLVFHDDGQDGDTKAGDGFFTAGITVDEGEFEVGNDFVKDQPAPWRILGSFVGRTLISGVVPTVVDLESFRRGERIQVHPSPFEGRGLLPEGTTLPLNARTGDLRALWTPTPPLTICVTNILTQPVISLTNILVKLDDQVVTNIHCTTNWVNPSNIFVTNIHCEPKVIGFTNQRIITNIDCVEVIVPTDPKVTKLCFTNVIPNPLRWVTNIHCDVAVVATNIKTLALSAPVQAQPEGVPQRLICVTNIAVLPNQPAFITNVICEDIIVSNRPIVRVVCITNIVADAEPVPIIREICVTNVVQNRQAIPIPVRDCVTNIAVIPGGEVLTNIWVTNFVLATNIVCTNVVVGGIDTNVITLPIDDVLNRPAFWNKSLLITDLSVVEDPRRTWDPCRPNRGTKMGAWTFGRLMTDVCNQPASGVHPGEFARRWLRSWQHDLSINFDAVTNRNAEILANVINDWEQASGGPGAPLDLSIAPFRLLAIVNRVDLRSNPGYTGNPEGGCEAPCVGGEGRFVFSLVPTRNSNWQGGGTTGGTTGGGWRPPNWNGPGNPPGWGGWEGQPEVCDGAPFVVIFEYCVPKRTCEEIKDYAMQWYALANINFGVAFNNALQAITDQFAAAGADPSRQPNLSALNQLRVNELLREPWDMREWRLFSNDSDAGWLREVTTKQTPDFDLNFSAKITDYALANAAEILASQDTVPLQFRGQPFLGGNAPMPTVNFFWDGPQPTGTIPTEIRHRFSLNTCNGCHAGETGTPFLHVSPRAAGVEAALSDFLTGRNMPKLDPADHVTRRFFADLKRREDDLFRLIREPCFFQLFHHPVKLQH
jgi:hypothetical protein